MKLRGDRDATRAYLACRRAIGTLTEIAARLPSSVGFERKKSLYLGNGRRGRSALLRELALRQAIGLRVDWLNEDDIAARFPFRRAAALLTHDAAQVDAYAFAHALLADAVRHGARAFDRTHVEKIDANGDGVVLRTSDDVRVHARHLVLAAGYETGEFLKKKVARLVSTYAVASEPMASLEAWGEDQCLIWEHDRPYLYLRSTSDRRVLIGGEDERFRDPARRDRKLPAKTKRLAERFRELFPDLRFDVAFSWAGTFGETRDGLAYIGEHPEWKRTWCALCYGGNGITYAVLAAEIIRDGLLGRRNEIADLFRFDR
jgi:glycine/D-amino acid oxidase-like deaminating enzyme